MPLNKRRNSMIKIRVSYEHTEELQKVVKLLGEEVDRIKLPKHHKGEFKKAYVFLKQNKN